MSKKLSLAMSMALIGAMSVSMVGCNKTTPTSESPAPAETPAESAAPSEAPAETPAEAEVPQPEDGAKLTLWGAADDQEMLTQMADAFKTKYADKNIEITLRVNGEDTAKDEVQKDLDAAADVFAIPHDQLGALVQSGAIYENTLFAKNATDNASEGAVTAATYDGKIYGYPSSSETYFLYYDTSIFKAEDVASLNTILDAQVADGVTKFGFDMGNAYFSGAFFLTNDCQLFGETGADETVCTFNNAAGLEMANFIAGLKAKGAAALDDAAAGTQFEAGKLGAYVGGPWKAADYKKFLGDRYGVAKLPTINTGSGDKQMKSFAGYKLYCVKSNTQYPVAAMTLADFLTNEENQIKRFEMRQLLPTNKVAAANEKVTSDATVAATLAQLEFGIAMPSVPKMSNFWTPTGAFTKDAFDGNIQAADMQAKLDSLVSDILQ